MNRPRFVSKEEHEEMVRRVQENRVRTAGPASAGADGQDRRIRPTVSPVTSSPYKSKWESAFAAKLDLEKHAGIIRQWWYEPFSLWLPGEVRYRPDFLIQYADGLERRLEIVEVKGWSRNLRDGMTRLKVAAAVFPCFSWKLVKRTKGGGWEEQTL